MSYLRGDLACEGYVAMTTGETLLKEKSLAMEVSGEQSL